MPAPTPADVAAMEMADDGLRLRFRSLAPHPVHQVPTYFFDLLAEPANEVAGSINIRHATSRHIDFYAGHIGYSVDPAWRGRRFAARALRLLLPLARRLELPTLWITCDPENVASRRSAELAGAELVEIVEVPETCVIFQAGHPRKCRYRLDVGAGE